MAFSIVMYGCERWTIKKAEHRRIDAFKLRCWRRLLRVPWTARRSNQSILKKINPEYSLEGLRLKLKLQYFSHLMGRADSLEKTLILGKIEGRRRRGRQRMKWLDGITNSMDIEFEQTLGNGEGQGSLACSSPWGCKESDITQQLSKSSHGHTLSGVPLSNGEDQKTLWGRKMSYMRSQGIPASHISAWGFLLLLNR